MGIKNDQVRNFVLVFLVLLSGLLSYNLWTAGRNIAEEEETPSDQIARSNVSLTTHSMSDTFRPTSVALHGVDNQYSTLLGNTYPLRRWLREEFEHRNLNRVESSEFVNYEDYLNVLQSERWLEFIYTEEQPIGMIEKKFEELPRDTANEFFDRMLINLDDQNTVYLYHTTSESLYTISILEEEDIDIDIFLNRDNIDYVGAFAQILESNIIYLPNEPLEVPNKSYVSNQLSDSNYIESFFPDTSLVDRRSDSEITRYIDLTKEVTFDKNTNTLSYLRQISETSELEATARFTRSFEQVNRFENWSDTFMFSAYDQEEKIVYFQREIDGYPVFSTEGKETISEVGLVESGVTHLKLPLRFIDTPITIKEAPTEELISGAKLITQLNAATTTDTFAQIDDITIGYSWDESEEESQVIYFNPEWFISMEGTWMTIDEFLELHGEVTYGL